MPQVFISYAHKSDNSKDFVQNLKGHLVNAGFDVWIDVDLLQAGQNWQVEIDNAIKASFAVIIIMTPEANESRYVIYEWAFALGAGKEIIPVLLESSDNETNPNRKPHPRLDPTHLHYLDCTRHFPPPYEKVVQAVVAKAIGLDQKKQEVPLYIKLAVNALESYEPKERKTAIDRLTQSSHPAAIEALADAVQHHIKDVRCYAALTLAQLTNYKDNRAVLGLKEILSTPRASLPVEDMYSKSIEALSSIGSYESVQAVLVELPRSSSYYNNYKDHFSENALIEKMEQDFVGRALVRNLSNMDGLPLIFEALRHKEDIVCGYAAKVIAKLGHHDAIISNLVEIVCTRQGFPLKVALEIFADIKSPEVIPELIRLLDKSLDDEFGMIDELIHALVEIGSPESIVVLIKAINWLKKREEDFHRENPKYVSKYIDRDSSYMQIIGYFAKIHHPLSIPILIESLADLRQIERSYDTVADVVANILEDIGTDKALDALHNWKTIRNTGFHSETEIADLDKDADVPF